MKYVTVPIQGPVFNATVKPKEDIATLLKNRGYQPLELIRFLPTQHWNQIDFLIRGMVQAVKPRDIVVYQTPIYESIIGYETAIHRQLKKQGAIIIEMFHDIDFVRFNQPADKTMEQIEYTDAIIVPSVDVKRRFEELGYQKPIIIRQLFDYIDHNQLNQKNYSKKIYFTGNLDVADFIENVPSDLNLEVYGSLENPRNFPNNVRYHGALPPDQISTVFKDGWGLVWNGNGSGEVAGGFGEYLKISWPHKLSLYIQAGLPPIVWSESLAASFVIRNELGIAVDNLDDLSSKLNQIDEQHYQTFCNNCAKFSQLLRNGFFTETAVLSAIAAVYQVEE